MWQSRLKLGKLSTSKTSFPAPQSVFEGEEKRRRRVPASSSR
jgi:hypothetical protein